MTQTEETAEPPKDLADEVLSGLAKAIGIVMFPWLRLGRDAPLSTRLWHWRYVYALFAVLTLFTTWNGLSTGIYDPVVLVVAPHVIGALILLWTLAMGPVDGLGLPLVDVPASWILLGVLVVSWTAVVLQTLRYTSPVFGITGIPFQQDEGEFIAPMRALTRKSDDAPTIPRLKQDVSTLAIGETGSGKTSALELLSYQLPYDANTAVIAHDFGKDFQNFYRELGFEVLRISVDDSDVTWNLFLDVEKERDFRELASAVFGEPRGSDPFHRPAKQVFESALRYVSREASSEDGESPLGHEELVEFLLLDRETMQSRLKEYDDLAPSAAHLDSDTGKSAVNVYQSLHENASPVFVGDFAATGRFSIREYIENPDDRVLIIDSAATEMASVGPMFRLLLDWSIRFAMESDTPVNFILDEVDQLPPLSQLHVLTARGRSAQARALLGIQTIGQLEAQYGKHADGIVGNCPQGVYFSGGEPKTTEYIQSEIGHLRQEVGSTTVRRNRGTQSHTESSQSTTIRETDRYPVPSGIVKAFGTGDCIVKSREHWWMGSIYQLSTIEHRLSADPSPPTEDSADTAPSSEEVDATSTQPTEVEQALPLPEPDPQPSTEVEGTTKVTDNVSSENDRSEGMAEPGDEMPEPAFTVRHGIYPDDLREQPQWLTWKETDDGRKIPRAPWASDWLDKYVNAQDPTCWTQFDTARDAVENYDGHKMAFTIRDRTEFPDETYVLVDYDRARDADTGEIHPTVREHIDSAASYTDVSTSGTGVHILCRGSLPDGVKSIDATLPEDSAFPKAAIEVYDTARFVAMTGEHLAETPTKTTDCQAFLDELVDEFATVTDEAPDQIVHEPLKNLDEIESLDTTDDIQDVLDAIQHIRPADIRLRSTITEERSDGSKSLDPSWEQSDSGTRLAQLDDGWVYRKGMHGLDAIQVVALEERIIHRPNEYPKGGEFWDAIAAVRNRGGHIPLYEPRESLHE
ncbi:type IV secretion system DNA-binding domain-containing protein [Haloarchaeobius sp. DFWS5]|uniref:type IV secretion system DNA-binding domain-containing protein n=1 Tax=Haloarchaeobius sp. DFWS5 TaxID=3446114 RepID=UPI003EBDF04A